jgi:hypothetical protein
VLINAKKKGGRILHLTTTCLLIKKGNEEGSGSTLLCVRSRNREVLLRDKKTTIVDGVKTQMVDALNKHNREYREHSVPTESILRQRR